MSASEKELDIINDESVVTEGMQLPVNGKIYPDRNENESTLQEVINPIIVNVSETVSNGEIDTHVKEMMETPVVKEMVVSSIAEEGEETLTVREELEIVETPIAKEGMETHMEKGEVQTPIIIEGVDTSINKSEVEKGEFSIIIYQERDLFVGENESNPVPKQGVNNSNMNKKLGSAIIEELIDIPKKRARMDTAFLQEEMEVPVDKGQPEHICDEVVKPSVNEEELETARDKQEQNVIDASVPNEKLAISIVDNIEDPPENGARMDTAFVKEEVEVSVDKGQIKSDEIAEPDNEDVEITLVKEEQNVIEIPAVEKELGNSIVNNIEDTIENSNSTLDDERVVLSPTKIDKNISFIKELILETDFSNWNDINYDEPYTTIELRPNSSEYQNIYKKFDNDCYRIIKDIKRVQNPFLYAQYHLKRNQKQSMNREVKEHILFHGTKDCNEDSICKNNLDFRKMGCYGYRYNKFGNGISFATNSKYAKDYPRGFSSSVRTMFVVKVLETSRCPGRAGLIVPPEPADLATSRDVYVKFFDNEFYPEYIVHYER